MKLKNILTTAAIACAAVTANAATTLYNDGDLLLGFRQTGSTVDYLVDLGSAASFDFSKSFTFNTSGIASDLAANFGAGWYADPTVTWSVIGTLSYNPDTEEMNLIYTTNPTGTTYIPGGMQGTVSSLVTSVGVYYDSKTSTGNNAAGVIQTVAGSSWTYANSQPGGSQSLGLSFQTWPSNEGTASTSLGFDVLHEGLTTGATLGSISIGSDGTVAFAAVPEPSTYAMVCVGALGMFRMLRRRKLNA